MKRIRLDLLLVERELVDSRSLAQRIIMAGQVRVNGEILLKPSVNVDDSVTVQLDRGPRYVSRGGDKLAEALRLFNLNVNDLVCADVGASTGGFTDCLLQNGARRVYAIDVGKGILHWKIRQDNRVVVMEQTNARYVERLPEEIRLASIDASFISLKTILPVVKNWMSNPGEVISLIKPQFEAGRKDVSRGDGVIRDPEIHQRVLIDVLSFAQTLGFALKGLIRSPLLGPKGNTEFLAWLSIPGGDITVEELVRTAMIK